MDKDSNQKVYDKFTRISLMPKVDIDLNMSKNQATIKRMKSKFSR